MPGIGAIASVRGLSRAVAFALVLPTVPLAGQLANPRFQRITIEDGLSQTSGRAILQDRHGFMWFGTEGGLNRFDGYGFRVWVPKPQDENSLTAHFIEALVEDRDGRFWVGSLEGLDRFDPTTERVTRLTARMVGEDPAPAVRVNALAEDSTGGVWIATRIGLYRWVAASDSFVEVRLAPAELDAGADPTVLALHATPDGSMWVGTRSLGLFRVNPQGTVLERFGRTTGDDGGLSTDRINTIAADTSGALWLGTAEHGLERLDPATGQARHYPHVAGTRGGFSDSFVNVVFVDSRGTVWAGTRQGLNRYRPDRDDFVQYFSDPLDPFSISDSFVNSIYEDRAGILWFGTETHGISRLDLNAKPFRHYRVRTEEGHEQFYDFLTAIHEDRRGRLWLGTQDGLFEEIDREVDLFRRYGHDPNDPNSVGSNSIRGIHEDSSGVLWISTVNGGFNRLNPRTGAIRRFRPEAGDSTAIAADIVFPILPDPDGSLWLGVWRTGLDRFDPRTETFTHYRHDPDDPTTIGGDEVYALAWDREGTMWITTFSKGVDHFDPRTGVFTHYTHDPNDPNSLSSNQVFAVLEDADGFIWFGTSLGMNRFDKRTGVFRVYTVEDGLPDNVIYGIRQDAQGYIWSSTNKGLARFDPRTETFRNYDVSHGLQSDEFNGLAHHVGRSGTMYFGGINGFNAFRPEDIRDNPYAPPVVLTDLQLYNRTVRTGQTIDGRTLLPRSLHTMDQLDLTYKDYVVSFEFAALHFAAPANNRYRYQLEGLDPDWSPVGTRRFVTYTNLPPGAYRFRIQGTNSDGVWAETGLTVPLRVAPPFWRTWWFYALSAITIVLSLVAGYRVRVASIKAQNRRLERQVTLRTDELNTKKTELEDKTARLEQTLEQLEAARDELVAQAHTAGMAEVATDVLHNIGNVMNSVNTSATMIVDRLSRSKLPQFAAANKLLVDHQDELPTFMETDPRAKKLVTYYTALQEQFERDHEEMEENARRLLKNAEVIGDVVGAQQEYASGRAFTEELSLVGLVQNALKIQAEPLAAGEVQVETVFEATPTVTVQKSKLIHVFINLIKNADEAMRQTAETQRQLRIRVTEAEDGAVVELTDTGCGIADDDLPKLFNHGFSTKVSGRGFGLHSCGNYVGEMHGKIAAASPGPGQGATFTVWLPRAPQVAAA